MLENNEIHLSYFFFNFNYFYLIKKKGGFPSTGSFLTCLQKPGLGQSQNQKLNQISYMSGRNPGTWKTATASQSPYEQEAGVGSQSWHHIQEFHHRKQTP